MLVAALLDLVLPAHCAGCGAADGLLCRTCDRAVAGPGQRVSPRPPPPGFPPCRAVAAYDGPVRAMLIAYKERRRRDLTAVLAAALARSVAAHGAVAAAGAVVLVPVPSRAAAVRERGTDTTRRLAAGAGRALRRAGIEARIEPVLCLSRDTTDSAGLGAPARRANLSGAMASSLPTGRWSSHPVVVVDDLVTTGATLAEAARALAAVGPVTVLAAAMAATARRAGVGLDAVPR